ncbi:hypothetical protein [Spiroplasma endosymbiont of Agriotes lineatus]|uniref:hypothetical protein n=1 Tax=Spiroplasma endosymbiont of Agriotes lineatus TaxID=3077930 RepID=UPI0030D61C90
MENLAKTADFLAQMLYKVFDLIWSLEVPGTNEYSTNISFILNAGCRISYGNYSWIW